MKKITTSLLVVASLNVCANAMERKLKISKAQQKKSERKEQNTVGFTQSLVAVPTNTEYDTWTPEQLSKQYIVLSETLALETSTPDMIRNDALAERSLIWSILKVKVNNKSKARELVYGYGDNNSDDEKTIKQTTDNSKWRTGYENSKNITDNIIPHIKTNKENTEAEIKAREVKIESLIKQINEANQELELNKNEMQTLQISADQFTKAILYQTKRKQQNEEWVKQVKETYTKELKKDEDTIKELNNKIEALLLHPDQNDFKENKTKLENLKKEALERKDKAQAELDNLNYYLPKINQPGSKMRFISGYGTSK